MSISHDGNENPLFFFSLEKNKDCNVQRDDCLLRLKKAVLQNKKAVLCNKSNQSRTNES
ncbi:hypothetical protein HJ01_02559 [Flavobacterium frigoris PS1]|uniref:Uncharacterized protein n=1 Tax=Flavobacterium frigoris (strain PS1) TaxID=1086011 RepID=H7FTX7_FLAFP|nr:hypothetical protein HJ01_02559 [Flavobacterium frigoris PS1]